jgi:hypothetical protein
MDNLKARTEIHDAWTNIVLADAHLARGGYKEASAAMIDAECHYRSAQSAVTIEESGSILNSLSDLKIKLDQLRSAMARAWNRANSE